MRSIYKTFPTRFVKIAIAKIRTSGKMIRQRVKILLIKRQKIPKGQAIMDNPEKLATYGTQDEKKQKTKTQHKMCWTPLYANKHK